MSWREEEPYERQIMDSGIMEQYESEMYPPEDVKFPKFFGYIHYKAYKYLKIGPEAYSAQDALGMPPLDAAPEILELVKQGCEQIVDWQGVSPEQPLKGIGINGFYRLMEVFHFKVIGQSAILGEDESVIDEMAIKHQVTGEEMTLFNLVRVG